MEVNPSTVAVWSAMSSAGAQQANAIQVLAHMTKAVSNVT